jgi:hypothetical protein
MASTEIAIIRRIPARRLSARYISYVAILIVNFINLVSYASLWPGAANAAHDDALRYIAMSQQTFAPVDNPFALRILSPWIAHALQKVGLGLNSAWLIITFTASVAAIILFFKILYDHCKFSTFVSLVVTLMLACTYYFTLFNFENAWLVDPVNNLVIVGLIYTALRKRLVLFAMIVLLGSVNKETTLLFAPLYVLVAWAQRDPWRGRHFVGGTFVIVLGVVAYFLYRLWVQARLPADVEYVPLAGGGRRSVVENVRNSLGLMKKEQQFAIFDTFHFTWLIFFYGLYQSYQRFGLRNIFVTTGIFSFLMCLFGRLFASDVQRVFVMMAPVLFLVVASCFARFDSERGRPWLAAIAIAFIAINLRWLSPDASMFLDFFALLVFVAVISLRAFQTASLPAGSTPSAAIGSAPSSSTSSPAAAAVTAQQLPLPRHADRNNPQT